MKKTFMDITLVAITSKPVCKRLTNFRSTQDNISVVDPYYIGNNMTYGIPFKDVRIPCFTLNTLIMCPSALFKSSVGIRLLPWRMLCISWNGGKSDI